MKNMIKKLMKSMWALSIITVCSCTIEEVVDPNGPSVDGVEENASKGQLNELMVGIEATMRNGLGTEVSVSGTMARELYLFDADPRNTGDILGKEGIGLDNNSFYSTTQWNGSYRAIKNANLLIDAAANTEFVSEAEANGYLGAAKTLKAYELVQILKSYGSARFDVADPDNLGPVLGFDDAIAQIRSLLDEAQTNLTGAGNSFAFPLSSGFEGFDTPATFVEFNRAVAAMAAVYAGDGNAALTALGNSYFDLTGALDVGPKHIFGLGGGDLANPIFRVPSTEGNVNNGDQIIVHNSWILDAEAGDARVAEKAALRPDPSTQDGLTGTHETRLYASNVAPVDILRNEELILISAEANILAGNLQDAENALNVIRMSAALPNYSGAQTADALTTELLVQRRYSLWSENHRMFDLRRYGLTDTLPIDRAGDRVFGVLPVPLSENE